VEDIEEEKNEEESTPEINPVETEEAGIIGEDDDTVEGIINMDDLEDVPLRISVQLGQCQLKMEEILKLSKGSIIGIDKLAGEPLEFFVGQRLAAKGEVVVLNEKFGLRLTDIIDPEDKGQ
jgi:flagellar motor switch protein FliN/FliY